MKFVEELQALTEKGKEQIKLSLEREQVNKGLALIDKFKEEAHKAAASGRNTQVVMRLFKGDYVNRSPFEKGSKSVLRRLELGPCAYTVVSWLEDEGISVTWNLEPEYEGGLAGDVMEHYEVIASW